MSRLMTKPTKWHVRPATTQISLGIRLVWSKSSLSAWRKLGSLATHLAQAKTLMHRLIWVFAGRTAILLVLSWDGSNIGTSDHRMNCKLSKKVLARLHCNKNVVVFFTSTIWNNYCLRRTCRSVELKWKFGWRLMGIVKISLNCK